MTKIISQLVKIGVLLLIIITTIPIESNAASVTNWCTAETKRLFTDYEKTAGKICLAHESYDLKSKTCVKRCGTEKSCNQIKLIEQKVVDAILNNANFFIPANADFQTDEPSLLSTYVVRGGMIGTHHEKKAPRKFRELQQDTELHHKLWHDFSMLTPTPWLNDIGEFAIVSDGFGGFIGETGVSEKNRNKLKLSLDPADIGDIKYTFVHELAHVIASSKREQDIEATFTACSAHFFNGKNQLRDSYANLFARRFWVPMGQKYLILWGAEVSSDTDYLIKEIESEFVNRFITDYAMTSPIEDFAESFAHFVLLEKPVGTDKTIPVQKIRFFYEFPELTRLRDSLRWSLLAMR